MKLWNNFKMKETAKKNDLNVNRDKSRETPVIPNEIFRQLPKLLSDGCMKFEPERERDVFLTGALTILSGCINNAWGTYDQSTVYPNLFCFIVAPPASGKSSLKYAKEMGAALHLKLKRGSEEAKRQYNKEIEKNAPAQKKGKKNVDNKVPVPPKFKILFIPANSSSAAVIKRLKDSGEVGIICETEADTLNNSFKQDWGGYSDLLRKSFHHEMVSYNRKIGDEFIEIEKPRLSVALSGTPSQVPGLISSAEDGLFSRFIFYHYNSQPEWKNVSPNDNGDNLTDYFTHLSGNVLQMVEKLTDKSIEFTLAKSQWEKLNAYFKKELDKVLKHKSDYDGSSIKRLGLITFRIAMVLSVIRELESGLTDNRLICNDVDFNTALKLAEVYLSHSMTMLNMLPEPNKIQNRGKQRFYSSLPNNIEFARKDAVGIGHGLNIPDRTIDEYLKSLTDCNKLKRGEKYGNYVKK